MTSTCDIPFSVGQEIYGAKPILKESTNTCIYCEGNGIITLKDEDFPCPRCNGIKESRVTTLFKYEIEETQIKKIMICIQENKNAKFSYETSSVKDIIINPKNYENYENYKVLYFTNKKEAEELVNHLNNKLKHYRV